MAGDILLLLSLVLLLIFLGAPVMHGAPYVPTGKEMVERMVSLGNGGPGIVLADLGSGDERIIIAATKIGAEAHAFEINPLLVWRSRQKIRKLGLSDRAFVHFKSFWKADFGQFDVITLFGITKIMPGLEKKMNDELRDGAKVVSYVFKFPNWQYSTKDSSVYVYEKN